MVVLNPQRPLDEAYREFISLVGRQIARAISDVKALELERARVNAEQDLRRIFEQAPSFVCIMKGPDHVFEFVNNAHRSLFTPTYAHSFTLTLLSGKRLAGRRRTCGRFGLARSHRPLLGQLALSANSCRSGSPRKFPVGGRSLQSAMKGCFFASQTARKTFGG